MEEVSRPLDTAGQGREIITFMYASGGKSTRVFLLSLGACSGLAGSNPKPGPKGFWGFSPEVDPEVERAREREGDCPRDGDR